MVASIYIYCQDAASRLRASTRGSETFTVLSRLIMFIRYDIIDLHNLTYLEDELIINNLPGKNGGEVWRFKF